MSHRRDNKGLYCLVGLIFGVLFTHIIHTMKILFKRSSEVDSQNLQDAETPTSAFRYKTYSTEHLQFQTWVDVIFSHIRLPLPITAVIIGTVVYLGGFLIASIIGFETEYVQTKIIYIGVFGIMWVVGIIRHSSLSIHHAYEQLRPCFLVDDKSYKVVIEKWYSRLASKRIHSLASMALAILAWTVVYLSFYRPDLLQQVHIQSLRPVVVEPFWYTANHLLVKSMIIAYYGICIAFPLGTSGIMLILNYFFLLDFQKFPIIPLPNTVRFRLRDVTDLYIFIATAWFVGVGLFGIVLFKDLDIVSLILLAGLSFLGTLTFLTPQYIYRKYLVRSYSLSSQLVLSAFYKFVNIELEERPLHSENVDKISVGSTLADLIQTSNEAKLWVYDPSDILLFFIGQVVSFGSVFIGRII